VAPSEQPASEFLKTNEFSYTGMSTNTGEKKILVMGRFTEGRVTKTGGLFSRMSRHSYV